MKFLSKLDVKIMEHDSYHEIIVDYQGVSR